MALSKTVPDLCEFNLNVHAVDAKESVYGLEFSGGLIKGFGITKALCLGSISKWRGLIYVPTNKTCYIIGNMSENNYSTIFNKIKASSLNTNIKSIYFPEIIGRLISGCVAFLNEGATLDVSHQIKGAGCPIYVIRNTMSPSMFHSMLERCPVVVRTTTTTKYEQAVVGKLDSPNGTYLTMRISLPDDDDAQKKRQAADDEIKQWCADGVTAEQMFYMIRLMRHKQPQDLADKIVAAINDAFKVMFENI